MTLLELDDNATLPRAMLLPVGFDAFGFERNDISAIQKNSYVRGPQTWGKAGLSRSTRLREHDQQVVGINRVEENPANSAKQSCAYLAQLEAETSLVSFVHFCTMVFLIWRTRPERRGGENLELQALQIRRDASAAT